MIASSAGGTSIRMPAAASNGWFVVYFPTNSVIKHGRRLGRGGRSEQQRDEELPPDRQGHDRGHGGDAAPQLREHHEAERLEAWAPSARAASSTAIGSSRAWMYISQTASGAFALM